MALFLKMARIASGTDAKMAVPLRPYGKERGNAVNRGFGSLRPTPFVRDGDFSASKLSRRLWDRLKNSLSSRRIRRLGSAHLSCGHRVRQNPVGRLPTGGPHTMNAFVHVTVSTTVLLFAGCGTGEPKGQGLPAALQESSAEQDRFMRGHVLLPWASSFLSSVSDWLCQSPRISDSIPTTGGLLHRDSQFWFFQTD